MIYDSDGSDNTSCGKLVKDYTEDAKGICVSGMFDKNKGDEHSFAINRINNKCESSIKPGKIEKYSLS